MTIYATTYPGDQTTFIGISGLFKSAFMAGQKASASNRPAAKQTAVNAMDSATYFQIMPTLDAPDNCLTAISFALFPVSATDRLT